MVGGLVGRLTRESEVAEGRDWRYGSAGKIGPPGSSDPGPAWLPLSRPRHSCC